MKELDSKIIDILRELAWESRESSYIDFDDYLFQIKSAQHQVGISNSKTKRCLDCGVLFTTSIGHTCNAQENNA